MYIVVFEFTLKDKARYAEIVTQVREELEKQPGFISIDRFVHQSDSAQGVSISSWESDDAIKKWSEALGQREANEKNIFKDFRWRVAKVGFDYGPENK